MTRFIVGLLVLFAPFKLFAQAFTPNPDWRFENFNSQNRFTSGEISALAVDKTGYVWACSGGIDRFDGYRTLEFTAFDRSKGSLRSNFVGVGTDNDGKVWISSSGLCWYDDGTGKFIYLKPGPKNNFKDAESLFAQGKYLWFVTEFGLEKVDIKTLKISFTSLRHITDPLCSALINDSTLLVSSREKVYYYNIKRDTWQVRTLIYNKALLKIFAIVRGENGVFLGTNYGLFRFNKIDDISMFCPQTQGLTINDLAFLPADKEQKHLFLATEGKGIMIVNAGSGKIEFNYVHDDQNPYSVPCNDISRFCVDTKGRLWLSGDVGIGMLDVTNQPLKMRFLNKGDAYELGINKIKADKFDSTKVWMSSYNQGMIRLNWKTKEIETIFNKDPRISTLYDFAQIDKNRWLLATQKAIIEWSPKTGPTSEVRLPLPDSVALVCNIRRIITADAKSCYITTNRGLFRYDLQNHTISIASKNSIWHKGEDGLRYILLDGFYDDGQLWITSRQGLYNYNTADGSVNFYRGKGGFSDYYFFDVAAAPKGRIICAAGSGITIFDKRTKTFTVENTLNNLYSVSCGSVITSGNVVWIGSEVGILTYNPDTRISARAELGTAIITVYPTSGFMLLNNELVFGFRNGFGYFNTELKNNLSPSDPVIERVYVNNQPVQRHCQDQKLTFNHNENSLSIAFTAFLYSDPANIRFRYRLKNADQTWHYTEGLRGANYAQLLPGSYTFEVQCGNKNGAWNSHLASFNFVITPPYWETLWFRLAVVIAIALVLYRLYLYKIKHLRDIEKIRQSIASDFHDDLGSTLSSISIFSEVAIKKADTDLKTTKNMVSDIGIRARAMIHSMNDMVWIIKPENDNLYRLMQRMEEFGYPVAEAKEIQLTFLMDRSLYNIKTDMQKRKALFLIFKEAFNNAVKYSNADTIKVQFSLRHKRLLVMQVSDNGCGFDEGNNGRGNGLGNMQKRAVEIKGKLKISTGEGAGTTVTIICEIT